MLETSDIKINQPEKSNHPDLINKFSLAKNYIKEIIYGANDGIITTFAVVAGFAGLGAENQSKLASIAVVVFGIANLVADGISMGLGSFLSTRSEKQLYESEKQRHLDKFCEEFESEKSNLKHILQEKGFSDKDSIELSKIMSRNLPFWQEFIIQNNQKIFPISGSPAFGALATFLAFISFGFIPLLPYLFNIKNGLAFPVAVSSSILALVLLGFLRWRIIGEKLWKGILEILIIGLLAGSAAFIVGIAFKQ